MLSWSPYGRYLPTGIQYLVVVPPMLLECRVLCIHELLPCFYLSPMTIRVYPYPGSMIQGSGVLHGPNTSLCTARLYMHALQAP